MCAFRETDLVQYGRPWTLFDGSTLTPFFQRR